MPEFNIPDDIDPRLKTLLGSIFDKLEKDTLDLKPVSTPQEGLQVGSIWYDESDNTVKVNTPNGVRTLQFV